MAVFAFVNNWFHGKKITTTHLKKGVGSEQLAIMTSGSSRMLDSFWFSWSFFSLGSRVAAKLGEDSSYQSSLIVDIAVCCVFFVCYWSIFFYTTKIGYASFSSFGWTNCHLTEFSYYFHTINFDQEAFVSLYYNDTWKAVGWRSMYKKPQLEQQRCQQQPKTLALCRACKQFSVAVVASWNTTHCCTQLVNCVESCLCSLLLLLLLLAPRSVVIELSSSSRRGAVQKISAAMICWDHHATFYWVALRIAQFWSLFWTQSQKRISQN